MYYQNSDPGKAEILVVFFSSAFTKKDRTNFPIVTVSEVGKKLLNCYITEEVKKKVLAISTKNHLVLGYPSIIA